MYVDLCIEYSLGSCIHRGATVNRDLLWACLAYQWDRMSDAAKALMVECANNGSFHIANNGATRYVPSCC